MYKKNNHDFWHHQPVSINNNIIKEGIITKPKNVKIKYDFNENYSWSIIFDVNELNSFLKNNYTINQLYTNDYLSWCLNTPHHHINKLTNYDRSSWNICLRNDKYIGTILGRPIILNINNKIVEGFYVDFLCVEKKLRKEGIAPNMIYNLLEKWKKAKLDINFFKIDEKTLPFDHICQFDYYTYSLKSSTHIIEEKIHNKLLELTSELVVKAYCYFYKKIKKYKLYQIFTIEEFEYYFLPRNNLIYTYITLDEKGEINGLANLITMKYIKNNIEYKTIELLYLLHDNTNLIYDIIEQFKKLDFDYLLTIDIMNNKKFIKELNFQKNHSTHYYLYNYNIKINKKDIGLVIH